jgi:hypothetical protein
MAAYSIAKLARVTVWDNPYNQHAPGVTMPALSFGFVFEPPASLQQPPYTSSTIDALPPMHDNAEFARAEWRSPGRLCAATAADERDYACEEAVLREGTSTSFPPGQIVLRQGQIVGLQFPLSGLRPNTRVLSATLSLEMFGEKELFPAHFDAEDDPLSVHVQVLSSPLAS